MAKAKLRRGRGKGISPIDAHVGRRLRQRRALLGMSQTNVGDGLGLSFQQVQKYENGTNRVSASRLFDLSRVLDVSVEHFFDDMSAEVAASSPAQRRRRAKAPPAYELSPMAKRETLELVRAYYKITDPLIRRHLFEMTKTLGAAATRDD